MRRRPRGLFQRPTIRHVPRARRGATVIEILVVLTILTVSVSIFSGMVVTTARQRAINRESAIAAEAARRVIETMRNMPFREVYLAFNEEGADDPGGAGTAPGYRFAVDGLHALPAAADGLIGEVHFADDWLEEVAAGAGGGAMEMIGGGGGAAPELVLQLREDVPNEELGTPRDLNGDSIIDALNHATDYVILPVSVRLEWSGVIGPRQFQLHAILTEFIGGEG